MCCWLYLIEWQKRGLPHAHILIWLEDKILQEEIVIDQELLKYCYKSYDSWTMWSF